MEAQNICSPSPRRCAGCRPRGTCARARRWRSTAALSGAVAATDDVQLVAGAYAPCARRVGLPAWAPAREASRP